MYNNISPKYKINLIKKINLAIWEEFSRYDDVEQYIKAFIPVVQDRFYNTSLKYEIFRKNNNSNNIDSLATIRNFDIEILFKMAIDLGIEIPEIIYCIPEIKFVLSSNYKTAYSTFEKAYKNLEIDPATSITLSNSALESVIKYILEDENILNELKTKNIKYNKNETLTELSKKILKIFKYFPEEGYNDKIINISSSLLNICKSIEDLRSGFTDTAHGKVKEDYIIDNSLYSKFIINVFSTIALFLINFYEKKYKQNNINNDYEDIPF